MSVVRLARVPLLGLTIAAAAGPPSASAPAGAGGPPAGPPNGTYTYALSRNGGNVGTTTVVINRRDAQHEIETDEAGVAAAANIHALGSYRYADLGVEAYAGTYQAPFLRDSPLGRTYKYRSAPDFYGQTTVRYRARTGQLAASIDGTPIVDIFAIPAEAKRSVRDPWIFDAPFMTGALLLPAFRNRSNEALLAPVSEAFPSGFATVAQRLVRATPAFPKTPKNDLTIDVPGLVRVWFDPATYIVHEVHFTAANFDARLVSYVKSGFTAPFAPQPAPQPAATVARETATFPSADGTSLAGLLTRPAGPKDIVPAILLVPPGPAGGTDFDGRGPTPMYPALALALVQRGYAVLRYDMRGVGKSGGIVPDQTWDLAVADAQAGLAFLAQDAAIDPQAIYVLGYGNGADTALAAAARSTGTVAGAVALAPTVLPYRNCDAAIGFGVAGPSVTAWRKSSLAHDPSVLGARVKVPLLVFHPGLAICGETKDQVDAYDQKLNAANRFATIVAATDLTQRFGSRYEAEAPLDSQAFFPYRFDAPTATEIVDWLDKPKSASASGMRSAIPAGPAAKPPPAPPGVDSSGVGLPNPHASRSARPESVRSVDPGVVLPSGVTPPPYVAPPPTDTPVPTPRPAATASAAPAATVAPAATPDPAVPATPTAAPVAATPTASPA